MSGIFFPNKRNRYESVFFNLIVYKLCPKIIRSACVLSRSRISVSNVNIYFIREFQPSSGVDSRQRTEYFLSMIYEVVESSVRYYGLHIHSVWIMERICVI